MASSTPPLALSTRVVRVGVSWPLIALGIAMLLDAHLGVAPFDVLNTGLAEATGIDFAVVYPLASITFFVLGALLGGKVGLASVLGTFVIGPLIGVFRDLTPQPDGIVARATMVVGATLILAIAVCLIITTELGPGPTEVFMLGLVNHNVPIVVARWVSDGLPLVVGAALGGSVGVGTVLFALALGPLIKAGLAALHYSPPHQPERVTAGDVTL